MPVALSPRRGRVAGISPRALRASAPNVARHSGMGVVDGADDDETLHTGTSGSGAFASPRSAGLVQALRKQLAERELALHSSQEAMEALSQQEEETQVALRQTRLHASALGAQLEDKLQMLHEAAMREEALEKELGAAQQRVVDVEQRLALVQPLSLSAPQHQVWTSACARVHTHMHTCTHAHTKKHAHMHTCTFAHMHTCTHTHARTRTLGFVCQSALARIPSTTHALTQTHSADQRTNEHRGQPTNFQP